MVSFVAPFGEMIACGRLLRAVADDLGSAHHRVEGLRSLALGSRSVDGALNHFADRWKYGMGLIVDEVDDAGASLVAAGEAYQRIDRAVADAIDTASGLVAWAAMPLPVCARRAELVGALVTVVPAAPKDWMYPALGFDPLPGDSEVAVDLARDSRAFGMRMAEVAGDLVSTGRVGGWTGPAADAFAGCLDELPRSLDRMAEAFVGLAGHLERYWEAFCWAQERARRLEVRYAEARRRIADLDCAPPAASGPPGIGAAGPVWTAPDPARAAAEDELEVVLREARGLAEQFEEAVAGLSSAIRALADEAPHAPKRSFLERAAGRVGGTLLAPVRLVDAGIEAAGGVLDDAGDLLSTLSGALGFASVIFIWAPGIGQTLALASLVTAAGATGIRTGLYVSGAQDEHGRPYVTTGELAGTALDTAFAAAGVGLAAGTATSASKLGYATALKNELNIVKGGTQAIREARAVSAGGIDAIQAIASQTWNAWFDMKRLGQFAQPFDFTFDLVGPLVAPVVAGEGFEWKNFAGISAVGRLPIDWDDLVHSRDEPDRADPTPGPAVIGPPDPERFMED